MKCRLSSGCGVLEAGSLSLKIAAIKSLNGIDYCARCRLKMTVFDHLTQCQMLSERAIQQLNPIESSYSHCLRTRKSKLLHVGALL